MYKLAQEFLVRLAGDRLLKRLVRNAGTLAAGNAAQAVLGVVALAVTARALPISEFGVLTLIITFGTVLTQLIGFQSWQAVIRYATDAVSRGETREAGSVIKAGILLDVSASVLAAIVGVCLVIFVSGPLGIERTHQGLALLVAVSAATNIVGTPTAVLRMFDSYATFVWHGLLSGSVKLGAALFAMYLQAGLTGFVIATVGSQVFSSMLLVCFAISKLRREGYTWSGVDGARSALLRHPQLRGFFLMTNLNSVAKMLRELDVAAVGLMAGAAAAGQFRIAKQIAGSLNRIADPFFHASYPDFSRMKAERKMGGALRLAGKSALTLGMCGILALVVFVIGGEAALAWVLGEQYRSAFPATAACILGAVIWSFAQPIAPLLLVFDRHRELLAINVLTSVAYLLLVGAACVVFGALGAGMAYVAFLIVWSAATVVLLRYAARRYSRSRFR